MNQDTSNQAINGHFVSIMVNRRTGQRYAQIDKGAQRQCIPVEILSLAAGRDAWMKDILVKCADCRTAFRAGDLECQLCPTCYDKAGEENERADAGIV